LLVFNITFQPGNLPNCRAPGLVHGAGNASPWTLTLVWNTTPLGNTQTSEDKMYTLDVFPAKHDLSALDPSLEEKRSMLNSTRHEHVCCLMNTDVHFENIY
jgi:hypothetical protein